MSRFLSCLQHSRPCCIGYTNSRLRLEFVYPIQHGRSCCKHYLQSCVVMQSCVVTFVSDLLEQLCNKSDNVIKPVTSCYSNSLFQTCYNNRQFQLLVYACRGGWEVRYLKKFINNSRGKYKRNECLINVCKSDKDLS